jgi:hypothetical protein
MMRPLGCCVSGAGVGLQGLQALSVLLRHRVPSCALAAGCCLAAGVSLCIGCCACSRAHEGPRRDSSSR